MSRRLLAAVALLATAAPAHASVSIAPGARGASLAVDSQGDTLVSWTSAAGLRMSTMIPPHGYPLPANRFRGPDVSVRSAVRIPMEVVVRRTPDGAYWALQAWRVRQGGPLELRFARWRGAPATAVTLAETCCEVQEPVLHGRSTYGGRPLYGFSPSPAGRGLPPKRIRLYAFLECFACPAARAGAWGWMAGVAPRPASGVFSLRLRSQWKGTRYRVTIAGPNRGWTYAPDARVVVRAKAATGP